MGVVGGWTGPPVGAGAVGGLEGGGVNPYDGFGLFMSAPVLRMTRLVTDLRVEIRQRRGDVWRGR